MLSLTDVLLLVLGIGALAAPVAHLLIAYLYAPRKISQWLESPAGMEAALARALPILGANLDAWSKTPEGEAFLGDLVDAIVVRGREEASKMMSRASGRATSVARAPLAQILAGIKTGNPTMDGMWAMVAPMVLPKIGPLLLRVLPQIAQGAGGLEQALGAEETP